MKLLLFVGLLGLNQVFGASLWNFRFLQENHKSINNHRDEPDTKLKQVENTNVMKMSTSPSLISKKEEMHLQGSLDKNLISGSNNQQQKAYSSHKTEGFRNDDDPLQEEDFNFTTEYSKTGVTRESSKEATDKDKVQATKLLGRLLSQRLSKKSRTTSAKRLHLPSQKSTGREVEESNYYRSGESVKRTGDKVQEKLATGSTTSGGFTQIPMIPTISLIGHSSARDQNLNSEKETNPHYDVLPLEILHEFGQFSSHYQIPDFPDMSLDFEDIDTDKLPDLWTLPNVQGDNDDEIKVKNRNKRDARIGEDQETQTDESPSLSPPSRTSSATMEKVKKYVQSIVQQLSQFNQKFTLRLIRMTAKDDLNQMPELMKDFDVSPERPIFFIAGGLKTKIPEEEEEVITTTPASTTSAMKTEKDFATTITETPTEIPTEIPVAEAEINETTTNLPTTTVETTNSTIPLELSSEMSTTEENIRSSIDEINFSTPAAGSSEIESTEKTIMIPVDSTTTVRESIATAITTECEEGTTELHETTTTPSVVNEPESSTTIPDKEATNPSAEQRRRRRSINEFNEMEQIVPGRMARTENPFEEDENENPEYFIHDSPINEETFSPAESVKVSEPHDGNRWSEDAETVIHQSHAATTTTAVDQKQQQTVESSGRIIALEKEQMILELNPAEAEHLDLNQINLVSPSPPPILTLTSELGESGSSSINEKEIESSFVVVNKDPEIPLIIHDTHIAPSVFLQVDNGQDETVIYNHGEEVINLGHSATSNVTEEEKLPEVSILSASTVAGDNHGGENNGINHHEVGQTQTGTSSGIEQLEGSSAATSIVATDSDSIISNANLATATIEVKANEQPTEPFMAIASASSEIDDLKPQINLASSSMSEINDLDRVPEVPFIASEVADTEVMNSMATDTIENGASNSQFLTNAPHELIEEGHQNAMSNDNDDLWDDVEDFDENDELPMEEDQNLIANVQTSQSEADILHESEDFSPEEQTEMGSDFVDGTDTQASASIINIPEQIVNDPTISKIATEGQAVILTEHPATLEAVVVSENDQNQNEKISASTLPLIENDLVITQQVNQPITAMDDHLLTIADSLENVNENFHTAPVLTDEKDLHFTPTVTNSASASVSETAAIANNAGISTVENLNSQTEKNSGMIFGASSNLNLETSAPLISEPVVIASEVSEGKLVAEESNISLDLHEEHSADSDIEDQLAVLAMGNKETGVKVETSSSGEPLVNLASSSVSEINDVDRVPEVPFIQSEIPVSGISDSRPDSPGTFSIDEQSHLTGQNNILVEQTITPNTVHAEPEVLINENNGVIAVDASMITDTVNVESEALTNSGSVIYSEPLISSGEDNIATGFQAENSAGTEMDSHLAVMDPNAPIADAEVSNLPTILAESLSTNGESTSQEEQAISIGASNIQGLQEEHWLGESTPNVGNIIDTHVKPEGLIFPVNQNTEVINSEIADAVNAESGVLSNGIPIIASEALFSAGESNFPADFHTDNFEIDNHLAVEESAPNNSNDGTSIVSVEALSNEGESSTSEEQAVFPIKSSPDFQIQDDILLGESTLNIDTKVDTPLQPVEGLGFFEGDSENINIGVAPNTGPITLTHEILEVPDLPVPLDSDFHTAQLGENVPDASANVEEENEESLITAESVSLTPTDINSVNVLPISSNAAPIVINNDDETAPVKLATEVDENLELLDVGAIETTVLKQPSESSLPDVQHVDQTESLASATIIDNNVQQQSAPTQILTVIPNKVDAEYEPNVLSEESIPVVEFTPVFPNDIVGQESVSNPVSVILDVPAETSISETAFTGVGSANSIGSFQESSEGIQSLDNILEGNKPVEENQEIDTPEEDSSEENSKESEENDNPDSSEESEENESSDETEENEDLSELSVESIPVVEFTPVFSNDIIGQESASNPVSVIFDDPTGVPSELSIPETVFTVAGSTNSITSFQESSEDTPSLDNISEGYKPIEEMTPQENSSEENSEEIEENDNSDSFEESEENESSEETEGNENFQGQLNQEIVSSDKLGSNENHGVSDKLPYDETASPESDLDSQLSQGSPGTISDTSSSLVSDNSDEVSILENSSNESNQQSPIVVDSSSSGINVYDSSAAGEENSIPSIPAIDNVPSKATLKETSSSNSGAFGQSENDIEASISSENQESNSISSGLLSQDTGAFVSASADQIATNPLQTQIAFQSPPPLPIKATRVKSRPIYQIINYMKESMENPVVADPKAPTIIHSLKPTSLPNLPLKRKQHLIHYFFSNLE